MRRSEARELAFTVLFEMDYHRELSPLEAVEEAVEGRELVRSAYFVRLVTGAAGQLELIDGEISKNAIGWKLNRISRVSRAILRLALFEMLHVEEIPHSIAINEAVELAKRYESQEAAAFINGVLGNIAKNHPKPGTEKKTAEQEPGDEPEEAGDLPGPEKTAESEKADEPADTSESEETTETEETAEPEKTAEPEAAVGDAGQ